MAAQWLPDRCPRCRTGALYLEDDFDTVFTYSICISCGARRPVALRTPAYAVIEVDDTLLLPAWLKAG